MVSRSGGLKTKTTDVPPVCALALKRIVANVNVPDGGVPISGAPAE